MQNPKDEIYTPSTPAVIVKPQSLVERFANRYNVDPRKLLSTLKSTAFKQQPDRQTGALVEVSDEEMMALLIVADKYGLDPFTKQIYAFRDRKRGGIVPIVGVDGWISLVTNHPQFNGAEFETGEKTDGKLIYVECTMHRKDREHPTKIREYLRENKRDTDAWTTMENRMLRHRAYIQCARLAFGFVGLHDDDEAERIIEGTHTVTHDDAIYELNASVTPKQTIAEQLKTIAPEATDESIAAVAKYIEDAGKPPLDLTGGPNFADVLSSLRGAKTPDDVAAAEDLARTLKLTDQQTAELDVEILAAMKRVAK